MNLLHCYNYSNNLKIISVDDLKLMLKDSHRKAELSEFIFYRHYSRYIKPFEYKSCRKARSRSSNKMIDEYSLYYKNGFSIMANCCLLIETIEAFYRGWENTKNKSKSAFMKFFSRDKNFKEFAINNMPTIFYNNIRCGILHQGETTGGWTISRTNKEILNYSNKNIDATEFSKTLKRSLKEFQIELDNSDWNSRLWKNVRKKLKAIIKESEQ